MTCLELLIFLGESLETLLLFRHGENARVSGFWSGLEL